MVSHAMDNDCRVCGYGLIDAIIPDAADSNCPPEEKLELSVNSTLAITIVTHTVM